MDHLYEELHAEINAMTLPAINILETDNAYVLQMALPGYKKRNLHLETQDDVLVISAKAGPMPAQYKDVRRFHKREFSSKAFTRSFLLPEDVSTATASFEEGILTIRLTKGERKVVIQHSHHCERSTIYIQ
jgi:HSP20 family protein